MSESISSTTVSWETALPISSFVVTGCACHQAGSVMSELTVKTEATSLTAVTMPVM
ncbi:hypothetical protein HOLleu_10655 [Holothuria leucospilota]|uniref:Uncharacterized protein n=1 Tax=Holothuria leucospilota TaxID=206669 RepID=A0A9Q1CDH8_HOLLE|nr:hypothetical protein HOLleu_10655 [Holothuria leucospilota]